MNSGNNSNSFLSRKQENFRATSIYFQILKINTERTKADKKLIFSQKNSGQRVTLETKQEKGNYFLKKLKVCMQKKRFISRERSYRMAHTIIGKP